jgi:hypothetical protein
MAKKQSDKPPHDDEGAAAKAKPKAKTQVVSITIPDDFKGTLTVEDLKEIVKFAETLVTKRGSTSTKKRPSASKFELVLKASSLSARRGLQPESAGGTQTMDVECGFC